MRLRLPPVTAYPHSIFYAAKSGEDKWGKPVLRNLMPIAKVRVDEGYDFKRSGSNATNDMPNALITMFSRYNPELPSFDNSGIVRFNGRDFTIVKVIPLYFMSDEIIGYELEVK